MKILCHLWVCIYTDQLVWSAVSVGQSVRGNSSGHLRAQDCLMNVTVLPFTFHTFIFSFDSFEYLKYYSSPKIGHQKAKSIILLYCNSEDTILTIKVPGHGIWRCFPNHVQGIVFTTVWAKLQHVCNMHQLLYFNILLVVWDIQRAKFKFVCSRYSQNIKWRRHKPYRQEIRLYTY